MTGMNHHVSPHSGWYEPRLGVPRSSHMRPCLSRQVLSASEQPGGPSAPLYQLSLDFENPQNAKVGREGGSRPLVTE